MNQEQLEAAVVDLITRDAVEIAPYPAVALKISALLRKEDFGIGDLVKLVASDQALAAKMIRVANSAMYAGAQPVSSVQAAVTRMGAKEVSSLALASQLGGAYKTTGLLAPLKRRIWQESLTGALVCQRLAMLRRQPVEDSFTCGLLHDFGRMVAATAIEKILIKNESKDQYPEEYWNGLVDKFHIELGLVMATRWNLSQLLCDVITLHHGDTPGDAENPEILDAVMATDDVVALAAESATVTPDDLVSIQRLRSATERSLVAATLPLCPALVATFEASESAPAVGGPSAVAVAASTGELHPLALDVVVGASTPYKATGVGGNVLILEGKSPLAINRLVQVTVNMQPRPAMLWMNPQRCELVGGVQRIEMKPFALSGDAATAWKALLVA